MAMIEARKTSVFIAAKKFVPALLFIGLAACGVRSQAIPDLNDQEAVSRVVRQLGVERTPQQVQKDEYPDGLYFQWWANRRIRFLNGQDGRCDVPASEAVATIGDAVALERIVAPKQIALDRACSDLMEKDHEALLRKETAEENARFTVKNEREEAGGAAVAAQAKLDEACRQRQQDAEMALVDPRKLDEFVAAHPCQGGNITGQ